jgi:N-acetylmuramic acid 6-phosphate etherase
MVDLKATNLKLRQQSRNILRAICSPACPASDAQLDDLLSQCNGGVKLALATLSLGITAEIAQQCLDEKRGMLAGILKHKAEEEEANGTNESRIDRTNTSEFVLCIDAGGSKCAATIMGKSGERGSGVGGPCNVYVIDFQISLAMTVGTLRLTPAQNRRQPRDRNELHRTCHSAC